MMRVIFVLVLVGSTASLAAPPAKVDSVRLGVAYDRSLAELLAFALGSHLAFRYRPVHGRAKASEFSCSFVFERPDVASRTTEAASATRLHAVLLVAKEPLLDQIGQLMESDATLPVEVLLKRLSIQRYDLFEETCPAVRVASRKFLNASARAIAISGAEGPRHWMDGDSFLIEGNADEIYFSAAVQAGNPLFQWAQETREALYACLQAAE